MASPSKSRRGASTRSLDHAVLAARIADTTVFVNSMEEQFQSVGMARHGVMAWHADVPGLQWLDRITPGLGSDGFDGTLTDLKLRWGSRRNSPDTVACSGAGGARIDARGNCSTSPRAAPSSHRDGKIGPGLATASPPIEGDVGGFAATGGAPANPTCQIPFRPAAARVSAPGKVYILALIGCAVEGTILQRVRIPPGNCRSSR